MKTKFLKVFYFTFLMVILAGIISTPHIITKRTLFLEENLAESVLLVILLIIAIIINYLYKQEINKTHKKLEKQEKTNRNLKEELQEAFAYIGAVNVQINAIRSLFAELNYPTNKKEMKQVMKLLAEKILSIVPADWVILRIINLKSQSTLREYIETRGEIAVLKHTISNKQLLKLENSRINDYQAFSSNQNTFNLKAYCILPKIKISHEQTILLQAALNQLEMLFLIFDSRFYKYREQTEN